MHLKITACFCFLLVLVSGVKSQSERLAAFSAVKIGEDAVLISWTMKAGISCQSPEVQRSADGLNFTSIYRYPGICGGGAGEESFRWLDENPLSYAINFYRLKVDEGEFSKIESVDLESSLAEEAVLIVPNPNPGIFELLSRRELGEVETVEIYDFQGKKIAFQIEAGSDCKRIQIAERKRGIYMLKINTGKGGEYHKKILIY